MSLCPYHLLRPRGQAGLSYIPRYRLRLGHLRPVTTNLFPARSIASHAPNNDAVPFNDDELTNNNHGSSATTGPRTHHPPRAIREGNGPPKYRKQRPMVTSIFSLDGRGRGSEVDGVPMIYTGLQSPTGKPPSLKPIEPVLIEQENKIRAKSLFRSREEFAEWQADSKEIYAIRVNGQSPENLPSRCLNLDDADYDLFEKLTVDGQHSFRPAWESLTKEDKSIHWQRLSLYLLYNAPDLVWEFLYVTCQNEDRPVFREAWICLRFLAVYFSAEQLREGVRGVTFDALLKAVLDPESWPLIFVPQKAVRFYLKHATQEELRRVYDLVRERKHNLLPETWLCFMYRFTHYGDIDTALEALSELPKLQSYGYDLDYDIIQMHCSKLLLLDFVSDGPEGRNFYILSRLLQMGIRPGRSMMNVVLSNAFKTGDPQLGYDMFQYMKSQGHEFDQFTYLTLLRDAVDRGDQVRVDELSEDIRRKPEIYKNPWIASKLIHARYVFTVKTPDANVPASSVFYSLLDMYNELYDLTPLRELSILSPHYTPEGPGENNAPSVVALFLMIATYLRCQKRLPVVLRVYTKFRSLAWQGHPTIAPMQETTHIYNEFLAAFRHDPRGLRPAVRLVEDMLRKSEQHSGVAVPGRPVITPAKPTVWTWNILLSAFVFQRQPLAVEKVREMMAKHNIEYDTVTWNLIISGHASSQDIPAVAQSIKDMEAQGLETNDRTLNALSYLRDPERLWVAVKDLDKNPELPIDHVDPDWEEDFGIAQTDKPVEREAKDDDDDDGLLMRGLQRLIKKE